MEERDRELVKAMVQLSWADGRWTPSEEALVGLILARIGLTPNEIEDAKNLYRDPEELAALERVIPDKPHRMSAMRLLLAVAYADLDVPDEEALYLGKMATRLGIRPAELETLMEETVRRDR